MKVVAHVIDCSASAISTQCSRSQLYSTAEVHFNSQYIDFESGCTRWQTAIRGPAMNSRVTGIVRPRQTSTSGVVPGHNIHPHTYTPEVAAALHRHRKVLDSGHNLSNHKCPSQQVHSPVFISYSMKSDMSVVSLDKSVDTRQTVSNPLPHRETWEMTNSCPPWIPSTAICQQVNLITQAPRGRQTCLVKCRVDPGSSHHRRAQLDLRRLSSSSHRRLLHRITSQCELLHFHEYKQHQTKRPWCQLHPSRRQRAQVKHKPRWREGDAKTRIYFVEQPGDEPPRPTRCQKQHARNKLRLAHQRAVGRIVRLLNTEGARRADDGQPSRKLCLAVRAFERRFEQGIEHQPGPS